MRKFNFSMGLQVRTATCVVLFFLAFHEESARKRNFSVLKSSGKTHQPDSEYKKNLFRKACLRNASINVLKCYRLKY